MYRSFARDLTAIAGIGPALAAKLANAGVRCLGDLLLRLPARWVDDRTVTPVRSLRDGEPARAEGRVLAVAAAGAGRRRQVVVRLADDDGAELELRFFHSPWLLRDARLAPGRRISVRGKPEWWRGRCRMLHPEWMPAERFAGGWRPVHGSVAGVGGARMAGFVQRGLELLPPDAASPFDESLPDHPSLRAAIIEIHTAPDGPDAPEHARARERLLLEELLTYLHLMRRMRKRARIAAPAWPGGGRVERFLASLPWPLTPAQQAVWRDIAADLASGRRMHRLVQGDVGAGKTVVAAMAMLAAVEGGAQAALMAPTSVLAAQHAETLNALLAPLGEQVALLTGALGGKTRRALLEGLADGGIRMVAGTHALISEDVRFRRLGLAVVDEQHRFGVRQRWALAGRGEATHLLAMTATPIPRTLALALYGDMDLSVMRGMPPGREPVDTRVVTSRGRLAGGMRRMLDAGGRIYWIAPRVDEDEASVLQRADALRERFPDAGVLALHGRMKPAEKEETLAAFADGRCRLLVSTTVVEVGVNVPEARLIVIEQAERYGLAQLHQLRGRVGRGRERGYCVLLPSRDAPASALERLALMARCHDGLELAELDLQWRGAGDATGVNQSGGAGFRLLDMVRDAALIHTWHARPVNAAPTEAMIRFWRPEAESMD